MGRGLIGNFAEEEMKWPWRDENGDGQHDDHFSDTWVEFYLLWIAGALTILAFFSVLYYLGVR